MTSIFDLEHPKKKKDQKTEFLKTPLNAGKVCRLAAYVRADGKLPLGLMANYRGYQAAFGGATVE